MKKKISAKFINGDIVKYTGRRDVAYGWRIVHKDGKIIETGFSAHMQAAAGQCRTKTPKKHELWEYSTRGNFARSLRTPEHKAKLLKRAKEAGYKSINEHRSALERENAVFAAEFTHEIVPVTVT